ncbi:hypothetical protein [Bradyrhizobium sp. SUTN9-2]|uniref:hypothetical protein n=1 Tax=Bradyrhizobium sp. SUTN9-2 TaxID=1167456 RepID=UPI001304B71E|nr:hypothetical protein [Bradyrhizobium sp. SUTN9-2]
MSIGAALRRGGPINEPDKTSLRGENYRRFEQNAFDAASDFQRFAQHVGWPAIFSTRGSALNTSRQPAQSRNIRGEQVDLRASHASKFVD